MVSICLKARYKYKKQALFLSCFGAVLGFILISATFCLVFSRHFAVFWVLFLRFLQFQLLFAWSFRTFCCVLGAVLGISAVSATFSRIFAGFWARFGCCFRSFRDYSSPSPSYCLCYQPMAIEHYANLVLLS